MFGGGGRERKDLSVPPDFAYLTSFVLLKLPISSSSCDDDDRLWNFGDRAEAGKKDPRREGSAPEHSLKSFKKYTDEFKEDHFRKDSSVKRELKSFVSGVESELFQSILNDPSTKIEVLYGDDSNNKSFRR
ncbi:hypothetical protein MLD38_029716 [Melastoma candidum]|uniref:Uncharacterized protein n=1 Tax=Melastoma candidum TaxID=119954 RepID=A0ACB9N8Q5_9MYRT|nr:hypothetical protein MLD38_029716 [Melastoma candidum]